MYGTVQDSSTPLGAVPPPVPPDRPRGWRPMQEGLALLDYSRYSVADLERPAQLLMLALTVVFISFILVLVGRGLPIPIPLPGFPDGLLGRRHHHHPIQLPDLEQPLPLAPEANLPTMFIGSQVRTRKTFGFGLYVFEVIANIQQEMVVTNLAAAAPRPSPLEKRAASLWRWSECSWSFVPGATAPQRERVECAGAFPEARCKTIRTDGTNLDPVLSGSPVVGRYTDDVIARSVTADVARRAPAPGPLPRTWPQLAQSTGKEGLFRYGEDWPLPPGLCYRTVEEAVVRPEGQDSDGAPAKALKCCQVLPDGYDLTNSVAINVVRTAPGMVAAKGRRDATFVPHRKENNLDGNGFPLGSEQIIYNKDFRPYAGLHTYTVSIAPDGITFYIDAPHRGLGIKEKGVLPVQRFSLEEFPSLKFFGPAAPGSGLRFNSTGGQTATLAEPFQLGHLQLLLNMGINEEWGGRPGEFQAAETFVRRLAYHPLPQARRAANFYQAENHRDVFDVDFEWWDERDWWHEFRRLFVADQTPYHSVLNVDIAEAPDGLNALRLRAQRNGYLSGRTLYRFAAPQPTRIVDRHTGKVWAATMHPGQFDVFPYPEGVSQLNVTIAVSAAGGTTQCDYTLNSGGWYLEGSRGNANQGHSCTFLPVSNAGGYITVLPDASVLMELPLRDVGGPRAEPEPLPQPVGDEDPSLDYFTCPPLPSGEGSPLPAGPSPAPAQHVLPPKSGVADDAVPADLPPPPPPPAKVAPAPPPEFPPTPALPELATPDAPAIEAPLAPPAPPG